MQSAIDAVTAFHRKMNAPISAVPTLLPGNTADVTQLAAVLSELAQSTMANSSENETLLRRCAMEIEELSEWLTAHVEGDLVAAADAWADRAYVLFGDAVAAGLPAETLFHEVHRSNMTKQLDSAGTGKAVKGKSYEPPQLTTILAEAASPAEIESKKPATYRMLFALLSSLGFSEESCDDKGVVRSFIHPETDTVLLFRRPPAETITPADALSTEAHLRSKGIAVQSLESLLAENSVSK